ncbi:MAG: ABC-F family ATP-binding cassette domain-containing protein [Bacteroidales bacterium]
MNYLSVENLGKSFGDQQLFKGISFGLAKGDKVALVARNGIGKSTLLRILAGGEGLDEGDFRFRKGVKLAFLDQDPRLEDHLTIDGLIGGAHTPYQEVIQAYHAAVDRHAADPGPDSERHLQEASNGMDLSGAWDYERRLIQLLDLFRITDTTRRVDTLSGGEKKRLALALVLLDEPEFLILDEPTNHLDVDMIEWLEEYLAQANLTLLMVTHDRYFLDRVCNRILELHQGGLFQYPGNYEYFLEKRAEQQAIRHADAERASQLLKRELEWLNRMPKARTGKSKSRIDAIGGLKDRARLVKEGNDLRLQVDVPRMGGKILEVKSLNKAYGTTVLLRNLTYKFAPGDRLGIVGRNGSGKTTLLNLLSGAEPPDGGQVDAGETVVMGYYHQMGEEWKPGQRVIDAVREVAEVVRLANGRTISASQFLEHFMFPPDSQYKQIDKLSGGERRRLHLLRVLIKNPNFLILDEPTNDLDLFSLNVLEEFLLGFPGCLVLVSHDRYFLDKLCDHMFVFEGEGTIKDHYGPYAAYRKSRTTEPKAPSEDTTAAKEKPKSSGEGNPVRAKTRLSYREQEEYKRLEPEIEALEAEKSRLEAELSSGALPYEELHGKADRVSELIRAIEEKMDRWMELGQFVQ